MLASEYERLEAVFREASGAFVAKTMEAWYALYEIYSKKLWKARFNSQNEWMKYVSEIGVPGLGEGALSTKLPAIHALIDGGVSKEIAAAAVASIPTAAKALVSSPQSIKQSAKDQDPNEYVTELLTLTPSEAAKRVRKDSGNNVEMWLHDWVMVNPNKVATVLVREDSSGYTSYDVTIEIKPQIPANQGRIPDLFTWLKARILRK